MFDIEDQQREPGRAAEIASASHKPRSRQSCRPRGSRQQKHQSGQHQHAGAIVTEPGASQCQTEHRSSRAADACAQRVRAHRAPRPQRQRQRHIGQGENPERAEQRQRQRQQARAAIPRVRRTTRLPVRTSNSGSSAPSSRNGARIASTPWPNNVSPQRISNAVASGRSLYDQSSARLSCQYQASSPNGASVAASAILTIEQQRPDSPERRSPALRVRRSRRKRAGSLHSSITRTSCRLRSHEHSPLARHRKHAATAGRRRLLLR